MLPVAITAGLALCVGLVALTPAFSADAVPATPMSRTDANSTEAGPTETSAVTCISNPIWSYTWNSAASNGTVTASGGYPGQPICTPLYIRAVSWTYDLPLTGGNPSWPQTFSGKSDYTVSTLGTFPIASPGVSCGQDDVYATFSTSGFYSLSVGPVLTGPGAPSEPPFLHQAIASVNGTGTGGSTWHTDPSSECSTTVSILKQAVTTGTTTALPSTTPGASFDYTIDVSNSGPIPAAGLVVSDTLPSTLTSTGAAVGPGWSCTTVVQDVNCTLSAPLAGNAAAGTIRVPVQLAATTTDPNVANTATLCGTNIGSCVSSQAVVVITPLPPVDPPDLPPLALSDLTIEKTASVTSVFPGGSYSYSIRATNPTAGTTHNVVVTDTLDPRLRLTATPSGSGWDCTVTNPGSASGYGAAFECELPYGLAAGSPKTFTVPVSVDPTTSPSAGASIDNTAEGCGTSVDCVDSTARVAVLSVQLETLPLPEDPTDPPLGQLPTLALTDGVLAHAGVDPAGTTLISIGALVLGLGLSVIAAGRRREKNT